MSSHAEGFAGGHGIAVPPSTGSPARPGEKVEAKRRWDTTSECAPAMRMVWDHHLSAAGVKWALILYECFVSLPGRLARLGLDARLISEGNHSQPGGDCT